MFSLPQTITVAHPRTRHVVMIFNKPLLPCSGHMPCIDDCCFLQGCKLCITRARDCTTKKDEFNLLINHEQHVDPCYYDVQVDLGLWLACCTTAFVTRRHPPVEPHSADSRGEWTISYHPDLVKHKDVSYGPIHKQLVQSLDSSEAAAHATKGNSRTKQCSITAAS